MSSQAYFDSVAQQWDSMRAGFYSEAVREKAYTVADLRVGTIAADIGAGTGFITAGLITRGVRVVAVDQSEAMLDAMRAKFPGRDDVSYKLGEAEHLPLDDESVDYVFANMYLHHVETPASAIAEMVRILNVGGKLVITDLDEHQFEFLRTEQHDRWMGFKRDDIQRWFVHAGLHDVIIDCAGETCTAKSHSGEQEADVSIFIASGTK